MRLSPSQAKAHMGLVPQEYNLSVFETAYQTLLNQGGYYGLSRSIVKSRVKELMIQLKLWDKRDSVVRSLSGGMKRRLMIIRALLHHPKVLILDEPTAGVDLETRDFLWSFLTELNQSGMTIILSTHYLEEAERLCDHVVILDHGSVVVDQPMSAVKDYLKKEYFRLYTKTEIQPSFQSSEFSVTLIDQYTLDVELRSDQTVNDLFSYMTEQSIIVNSIENQTKHLENVFRDLTMRNMS